LNEKLHIYRLSAVYGPERSALDNLEKSRDVKACIGSDDAETIISRIHVDDIVNFLVSSMHNPSPGLVVNLADDLPSSRFDVYNFCCRLLNYPIHKEPGHLRSPSRGGSKRIDNSMMCGLLRLWNKKLLYPDYRVGLAAVRDTKKLEQAPTSTTPTTYVKDADMNKVITHIYEEMSSLKAQIEDIIKKQQKPIT